jgi:hypothetical protein
LFNLFELEKKGFKTQDVKNAIRPTSGEIGRFVLQHESLPVTSSWEKDTQIENIKEGIEARTGLRASSLTGRKRRIIKKNNVCFKGHQIYSNVDEHYNGQNV